MRSISLLFGFSVILLVLAACGGNSIETPPGATEASLPTAVDDSGNGEGADTSPEDIGGFDPFPFGTPIPDEQVDPNRPPLEPTLMALGAPVQPTIAATVAPFGGADITAADIGRPGEVRYNDSTGAEPTPQDSDALPLVDPTTILFERVSVLRAGGIEDGEMMIDIFQDGTVLLDGQQVTTLTPQRVIELDTILDEIRFFQLSGQFASLFPDSDDYIYVISVEQDGGSVSHRADDDLMPPELGRVVGFVMSAVAGEPPGPNN